MLIAALTVLLVVFGFGGPGGHHLFDRIDEASEAVEDVVADRDRAEELVLLVKDMELEILRFEKELRRRRGPILALDLEPGATREQYRTAFRAANAGQAAVEDILLGKMLEMRGKMSAEEWRALFDELREDEE